MKTFTHSLVLMFLMSPAIVQAIDLREATFTQVVNSVSVTDPQGTSIRPAQVSSKFTTPDIIRTGANSRAELTAADQTVTRVGANTIFSFKPEGRGINLQQGSVLFNSPSGKGGGTIQTAAATASVLGTTIIVSTTSNGGFKLLVLEGTAKATLPNGRDFILKAGQMTFITPGMTQAPSVFEFRLGKQNDGSNLLKGFTKPLPGQDKVQQAVMVQEVKIASGEATDTGLMIGQVVGNEIQIIDPSLVQAAMQTLMEENRYNDLINKLKQAVTVDRSVSSTLVDDSNALLFPTSIALKLGLDAVEAQVGPFENPPDKTHVFAAKNLYITSSTIDLSPYSGKSDTFAFFTKENMYLPGTLLFTGYTGEVVLHADGYMSLPTALTYNGSNLQLEFHNSGGVTLSTVVYHNSGGDLGITNLADDITLNGGNYDAAGRIEFEAHGDLYLNSPSFNPGTELSLRAVGGNIVLSTVNFSVTGRSLYVDAGGTVTFSAGTYNNLSRIEVNAGNGIYISNNMNVTGDLLFNAGSGTLSAVAGGTYNAGGYIEGRGGNIDLVGPTFSTSGNIRFGFNSNSTLTNLTNCNFNGNIIDFYGHVITSSNSQIQAKDNITIASSSSGPISLDYSTLSTITNSINITGGTLSSLYTNITANKNLYMKAVVGSVNLTSGSFIARDTLTVNAARSISVNTSSFSSGVPNTGVASFVAGSTSGDSITMNNVNLNTTNYFNTVSMQAHTIYLSNVDLSANTQYYFKTLNGGWNFGAPIPGTTNMSAVSNSGVLLNSGNIGSATNLHFPSMN